MTSLKNTTAILACFALTVPGTLAAQGNGKGLAKGVAKQIAGDSGFEMCEDTPQPPCILDDMFIVVDMETEGLPVCEDDEETPCVTDDGYLKVRADSELGAQAIAEADAAALLKDRLAETEAETDSETDAEVVTEGTIETEGSIVAEETAPAEAQPEQDAGVASADAGEANEVIEIQEAPPAAAAATAEASEGTVETEEVTEETARSSSEDFQTDVAGDTTAEATLKTSDDDKGLSNFEKALIVGLGAIAVGSILDNGDEVVTNSGDRVVLRDNDGELRVLKNDDALLRQPGSEVRTETFNDGSTRTTVTRDDGTSIVTIRAADGRVVRRVRKLEDGREVVLIDDTEEAAPVRLTELPEPRRNVLDVDVTNEDELRRALAAAEADRIDRRFSLRQIRQIEEVRELAPQIDLDAVTFATGSAAIQPSQAEELAALGRALARIIDERPGEVFLIEGHTDAVGDASYNLALSDRRAETVALALTEYFDVPPENMVTQGYGEAHLKVATLDAERMNRRATVRRITPLLGMAALN